MGIWEFIEHFANRNIHTATCIYIDLLYYFNELCRQFLSKLHCFICTHSSILLRWGNLTQRSLKIVGTHWDDTIVDVVVASDFQLPWTLIRVTHFLNKKYILPTRTQGLWQEFCLGVKEKENCLSPYGEKYREKYLSPYWGGTKKIFWALIMGTQKKSSRPLLRGYRKTILNSYREIFLGP